MVMTDDQNVAERLTAFYTEAQAALAALATYYRLHLPEGHVGMEQKGLHWRFTVYVDPPEAYWADQWNAHATRLGFGIVIEPHDVIIDQEGHIWTLLGLDPTAPMYPVRLKNAEGLHHMASVESAQLFQLIRKAAAEPDPAVE